MEISARAKYDAKTMKSYLRFNMFKGRFYKFTPYLYGVAVVVFIFIAVMYQVALGFQLFMTAAAAILTIAYAVQIGYFYAYPVMKIKKRTAEDENETVYAFSEDGFEFYTTKAGEDKKAKFTYTKLFKVFETGEYIYMYINKTGAFIVDKSTVENASELSAMIKQGAKNKYVKCI